MPHQLQTESFFPTIRMRRLRYHPLVRDLVRETELTPRDFVAPLFVREGRGLRIPISSMPGHFQLSLDHLMREAHELGELGIPAVLLFGIPSHKDARGSSAWQKEGVIQQAVAALKESAPHLLLIVDLCLCDYTDHGHCGPLHSIKGVVDVDNDATLEALGQTAISLAEAGADVIAPSGMMDGMVKAIRHHLDTAGYIHIPILSYAVKYASAFYGPFREAAESAPQFGDRKSYQMDPANGAEALREAALDVAEGTDMLMVKPAGSYLDIIHRIKTAHPSIPLAAYQVSGEFAMIKAAAQNGWIDEKRAALETLTSIKRAGADFIIHYFCKDAARWLG